MKHGIYFFLTGVVALSTMLFSPLAMGKVSSAGDSLAFARTDYAVGNAPLGVAIGDFNRDGKPDIVTANENDNTVSVLLNKRDGSFHAQQTYPVGHFPHGVASGDFNRDGKPD